MSLSSGIDQNNPDPDYRGKFYPDLIPFNHPLAQQGLGSVLQVNNSAFIPNTTTAQDATDFATLGCVKIETGTVGMGNQPALVIGEPGDLLQIKGATLLGSMLVGNGVNTETLPIPSPALPDGSVLILDSSQPLGIRWGGESGDINSITPGANINITGTTANPIVALQSPLTSTLNMGAVSITDSAGAVGTSGQVLTAGTGGQTLWGTNGVSSITAGSNIGITGTASVPIVGVLNPLTSTLNLGTQSMTGSTSNITLSSGTNQANMNGNLGFTSAVQATPTTKATLFNTSITIETSTNKMDIRPTQIFKTGSSTFTITNNSSPLSLSGNGAGADGVVIQQSASVATALTTSLSNVKYYPDTLITNNNSNTVAVPFPQVDYQRLTLTNLGLTNTNSWNDYGTNVFTPNGFSAFFYDSNGNVWLAENGTGNIRVCDNPPVNILHTITLANGSGSVAVNVFYEYSGYVFIGGTFDSINGNATPQYNITRVLLSSYTEDPMGDTLAGVYGTAVNSNVFGMTNVAGVLALCGDFSTLSNFAPCSYICEIANPTVSGTNQVYSEMLGGVNNKVYAIYFNGSTNRVYFGGDFTTVDNSSPIGYAYGAYYNYNTSAWLDVANNSLNGSVYIIKPTSYGYTFLGGAFTAPQTSPYSCYIEDATPQNSADTTLVLTSAPTYKHAYGIGGTLGVYGSGTPSLFISSSFQTWVDLGQPGSGSDITGINYWSGNYKALYNNYEYVRSHFTLPHSCVFTGPFKYDNVSYANYTIVPRNVSQQFIGDDGSSYWSIIGQGVGSFS
jgi:hypothetical protein